MIQPVFSMKPLRPFEIRWPYQYLIQFFQFLNLVGQIQTLVHLLNQLTHRPTETCSERIFLAFWLAGRDLAQGHLWTWIFWRSFWRRKKAIYSYIRSSLRTFLYLFGQWRLGSIGAIAWQTKSLASHGYWRKPFQPCWARTREYLLCFP